MDRLHLRIKLIVHFILINTALLMAVGVQAQTSTEMFETEYNGSTSFTDNGVIFNIESHVGTFAIQGIYPATGWNGVVPDNRYIDNTNSSVTGGSFSIKTTSNLFKVNRFWIFLADPSLNQNVSGTLTITGKLSGVTKFTQTKTTGFATGVGSTNGYTLIDLYNLNGQNYTNIVVDEIRLTIGGAFRYMGLDAFTWVKDPGVISGACSPFTVTTSQTNVTCNGASNGTASVSVAGGPYTYSWNTNPVQNTATATNLSAGTYSVVITKAPGCQEVRTFTITQPAAVSGTTVVTNVACNGASTGAINLTPTGGVGPYTFNWGNGITTEDRTNLPAGSYSVTITDANGCAATLNNITVTQPTAVSGTTVVTNVACNGASTGAINLTPTGGVGPYTFNWGGGITTEDRTNLPAGSYSVTITDANGCTGAVTAVITQPAAPISGSTVVTNVACNGASTGAINLTPTGGVGPYTFNWGNGITTEDRTNLPAGSYSVTITDANGCTGAVTAVVSQPTAVSGTLAVTNVACNGASAGAINLTPTGGVGPYTFNWGGGITTEDRTNLPAGSYSVTITDANGCTATVSATVTQPATAMSATISQTNVSCNGGSNGTASIAVTGGTAPYTYAWSPTGGTSATATGLPTGNYTVTVTDNNGCTITRTVTITQPTAVSGTLAVTNVACNGGTTGAINLTPTGGTAPYTYNWGNGITTEDRTNLPAGSYSVTITDAKGCTKTLSNIIVSQPVAVVAPTGAAVQSFANGAALSALVVNGENIKWYSSVSDAANHVNSLPLTITIVNNTTYYATQTIGACESTSSLEVLAYNETLAAGETGSSVTDLRIYPNPVTDILNFTGSQKISRVLIFTADGRKVSERKLQSKREINVSALVQGIYVIQVITEDGKNQTFRVIKK